LFSSNQVMLPRIVETIKCKCCKFEIFGSKSDYEKPWAGSSCLYQAQDGYVQ